jgi:hypothetical protein
MRRSDLKLGLGFIGVGVILPLLIQLFGGNIEVSVWTFVLCMAFGGVFLFVKRRAAEQESGSGVATLFGGRSMLSVAQTGAQGFDIIPIRASESEDEEAEAETESEPEEPQVVAELQIDYSHNECDSPRLRAKPLVLKNLTSGSDAFRVRVKSVSAPQSKLIFRPEVISRLAGGDQVEVVPIYEEIAGEAVRPAINQLPDFIGGFYNPAGTTDLKALNEIYEEKPLMLEVEYESAGKWVVARCELLFTQWHKNIRMGRQEIRVMDSSRR